MTRFWPEGLPIQVEPDAAGLPWYLRWQGRDHPVRHIVRRWRVDTRWWREPVRREYISLITTTGLWLLIYRDLDTGQWCVQRLYD